MTLSKNLLHLFSIIAITASCSQQQSPQKQDPTERDLANASFALTDIPLDFQNCTFNGETYSHGDIITAFQNSSVSYGEACVSEQRTCTDGVFSGSYQYASCNNNQPASCLFNGQTIAHGDSVKAFQTSSVSFDEMCLYELRTCNNGILSGSNQFASCNINKPASCLFNGQTIEHGKSVIGFLTSTVPYGSTCSAEERLCYNGILDGTNEYASCTIDQPASCLINGQTIAHGQSTILFQNASVPHGESCLPESRICDNGNLSGSYTNSSCTVEPAPVKSCTFNGETIAHGQSVTAYPSASVTYNQTCQPETRTCNDGFLSGAGQYSSCTVQPKPLQSCTFNGKTIAHGGTVTAYKSTKVGYGSSCQSEVRTCTDGILSGSNQYSSCSVQAPKSCSLLGIFTIPHGFTIYAALGGSTPKRYGQCEGELTLCNNGHFVLDGKASCEGGKKSPGKNPPPYTPPSDNSCSNGKEHSDNGKHLGWTRQGDHTDMGLHLGWYKKNQCGGKKKEHHK